MISILESDLDLGLDLELDLDCRPTVNIACTKRTEAHLSLFLRNRLSNSSILHIPQHISPERSKDNQTHSDLIVFFSSLSSDGIAILTFDFPLNYRFVSRLVFQFIIYLNPRSIKFCMPSKNPSNFGAFSFDHMFFFWRKVKTVLLLGSVLSKGYLKFSPFLGCCTSKTLINYLYLEI